MASDLDLPPVIGHRGAAAYAPENTLGSFRAAKALGCGWVEFDVRLTGDGALVVCHDDTLARTTGNRGRISKLPLDSIRQMDAGSWFGPGFAGERIPTLDETLALCREMGLGTNVEIKAERGRGAATAAAVAICLSNFAGALPSILISSFLVGALGEMARLMPSVPRGILWRNLPGSWQDTAKKLGCATVHCAEAGLSRPIAGEVRAAGFPLLAYTVNDAKRALELLSWGVASVFSDAPDIMGH
jgi:glycerophosphoryl diester phosphodiesterase